MVILAGATLSLPANAQTAAPSQGYDVMTSPNLFGDWNGLRTSLHNQGVDFQLGYASETVTNWMGGDKHLIENAGQFQLGSTFDLQQIFGIQGGSFQVTVVERNGRNLAADANLGTLQLVNEIYGRGDIFRLTDFYYDQKFDNGAFDFKIGRLTYGGTFAAFSCDFINLTFCGAPPGNLVGYIFNWPVSQWAAVAKANIGDFGYVQVGAYDINPSNLDLNPGIALAPSFPNGSTGVMIPVEAAWLPTFGNLAGSYKFGGWYDTSTANDVLLNTAGQPLVFGGTPQRDTGRWGYYINFKQQVTADPTGADPKHGLFGFFNATFTDDRTSTTDRQIAGGFLYHGPFDSRPNDDIGFAIGTTHVNPRIADGEAIANAAGVGQGFTQTGELTTEVFYGLQATGWLNLKGSLEYIHNPGGTNFFKDVIVSAVRVSITF
ncbi:MAG: carbohydrate porin [Methylocella sp.]